MSGHKERLSFLLQAVLRDIFTGYRRSSLRKTPLLVRNFRRRGIRQCLCTTVGGINIKIGRSLDMKLAKTLKANLKHLEVAQRALNCVDIDLLSKDPDAYEYNSEMQLQWERAMYAIDDLIGAFSTEQYEADDTD